VTAVCLVHQNDLGQDARVVAPSHMKVTCPLLKCLAYKDLVDHVQNGRFPTIRKTINPYTPLFLVLSCEYHSIQSLEHIGISEFLYSEICELRFVVCKWVRCDKIVERAEERNKPSLAIARCSGQLNLGLEMASHLSYDDKILYITHMQCIEVFHSVDLTSDHQSYEFGHKYILTWPAIITVLKLISCLLFDTVVIICSSSAIFYIESSIFSKDIPFIFQDSCLNRDIKACNGLKAFVSWVSKIDP
jgi:hypothetical protein